MSSGDAHLTEEQLQDVALSPHSAEHLAICVDCRRRFHDIERAAKAYIGYRDLIREPQMPPAPKPWLPLSALVRRHQAVQQPKGIRWWTALGLATTAACVVLWMVVPRPPAYSSREADEILDRSSHVVPAEGRMISMRTRGRTLVRPALLVTDSDETDPELARLRRIFTTADYSWQEPLSARSFQAWRGKLQAKRDSVSVLHEAYQVRTESPNGTLRSVSLTLRAEDLRPIQGTFSFEGEGAVESAEVASQATPEPARQTFSVPESPATPEDTLRVLAALNRIGADVGDPISFVDDPRHRSVLLSIGALGPERQREVAQAVRHLPRVELHYDRLPAAVPAGKQTPPETTSSSIPSQLRKQLEDKAGGAIRLQEITDEALDASSLLLARSHAFQLLAVKFPPATEAQLSEAGRELLGDLRRRHLAEMANLAAKVRTSLQPILGSPAVPGKSAAMRPLTDLTGQIDVALNRLLAGSYSQSSGEEMLANLAGQMEQLENLIRSKQSGGH